MELHPCWKSQVQGLVIHYQIPIKARGTISSEPPLQVDPEEMLKIPQILWWKTPMPSGKSTMFSHILCESLSKPKALHLAHWQAAVFQLHEAQQEAAGWCDLPLAITGLYLQDYVPPPLPPTPG